MKLFRLALFLLLAPLYMQAQTTVDTFQVSKSPDPPVFTFAEQAPEFRGGDVELLKFIQRNIVYPKSEQDKGVQGQVLIRFVVAGNGSVEDVKVIRGVSPALDYEAMKVVMMLPEFRPGKTAGKPVRVYFNLPIVFKL